MRPKIYHVSDHDIDPNIIDSDAVRVIHRLKEGGFTAYLVGGSVRDLLVKKTPKDYDISTSAKPEQIKHLFGRQCLLIGRRFRLAHIRFGHKILEVSTFRSGENDSDLIIQDNQWGTPEEDVLRRDFTINGLFYDPSNHTVIDYVGGWEDIHSRVLRTIGPPSVRFKQDPVRMIRLLKFVARFDFDVHSETRKALGSCHEEIIKSSPARILEEILRMLESGASASFFRLLHDAGMLEFLFPCLKHFFEGPHGKDIYRFLEAADQFNRNAKVKPLDRAVLTSCLLYPILEREMHTCFLDKGKSPHMGDVIMLTSSLIRAVVTSSFSHFPRRISSIMSYILSTQYRLTPLSGRRHPKPKTIFEGDFEFALMFLKLRSMIDENCIEAYEWWKHLYRQHHQERHGHFHRHHANSDHEKTQEPHNPH